MAKGLDAAFIALVCVSLVINVFVYPHAPDLVATHWNGQGMPDTYMMKGPGLFMITLFLGMFALIFTVVPKLPHVEPFAARYYTLYCIFSTWFMGLIFLINIHVALWNTGILKVQPVCIVAASFLIPVALSMYFMARRKYPRAR